VPFGADRIIDKGGQVPEDASATKLMHQRTGKELILATKPFARDSTVRSWFHVLSTAVLLAATMAGTLWNFNLAGRVACSLLAGPLILRFFVIYHDQQHHAILAHSRLAEALMKVFGLLILSPSSIWRSSHNYHHKHNSKMRSAHIGSFPVMTRERFLASSKAERFNYLAMRHPLTILFGYFTAFLWGMCLFPFFNQPKKHWDCLLSVVLHALIWVAVGVGFGPLAILLTLAIPCLVAHGTGAYLFYAQHNFPDVTFCDQAGWTYEKAALESSSYLVTGSIGGWFTGNIGFHHAHHLNARVPFYRLPEMMSALPELQSPKRTSLNPMDIFRCLRLKVWDVKAQRMISRREIYGPAGGG
jgi:acyl-lipid omega-6 desaturase (Delta-12 desaturase)